MGARFKKDDIAVDISDGHICVTGEAYDKTMCVRIIDDEPLESITVDGIYSIDGDKMIPFGSDIDMNQFSLLVGEVRQEAVLRRVKHVFFDTPNPTAFRLLKRMKWSTIGKSKREPCYREILNGVDFCKNGQKVTLRKSV